MTPFSSVAMLEKLALLKIAFCKAPVLSRASSRRPSVITSTVTAASSEIATSWFGRDTGRPYVHEECHPLAAFLFTTAPEASTLARQMTKYGHKLGSARVGLALSPDTFA